jgi:hypothetical protein
VKDALQNQTLFSPTVFANVTMVMLISTVFVHLKQFVMLNAMLEHILTLNFKNVYHALMDV